MSIYPQQSFQHTLREISVNRHDPCELIRELVSNSYDALASHIWIFPLHQKKGILFIDDGDGLSEDKIAEKNGITPYVAFFSIGKGTKTEGEQIGYKCQGSKLCFASRRFSLLTRCKGESSWRWLSVQNPKEILSEKYDLSPEKTSSPLQKIQEILSPIDERTRPIIDSLKKLFESKLVKGTILIIEDFEVENFESFFSTQRPSYLYEYIRLYTAHGDTRLINKIQGFKPRDVTAVTSTIKRHLTPSVQLWMEKEDGTTELLDVPNGWPYLVAPKKTDPPADNPEEVSQLRKGRFWARYATAFKFDGRWYSLILAIDGKRRTLDEYDTLGRQSDRRSGIRLSDQRGVILSSQGVRICGFPDLFEEPLLAEWKILSEGWDHFAFIIDGPFELVTNRNNPAHHALQVLQNSAFLTKVADFLRSTTKEADGPILQNLLNRLSRETTIYEENQYLDRNRKMKESIANRPQFSLTEIPTLKDRWFVAPLEGEEHFVGALYTLFSHLIDLSHPLSLYWKRPLTFSASGIDAIAVQDEMNPFNPEKLLSLEYKYRFSTSDEFNHPLNITNRVICWDLVKPEVGETIRDTYSYLGTVKSLISANGIDFGCEISDLRHKHGGRDISHTILVLSLREILKQSFKTEWRSPPKSLNGSNGKRPFKKK